MRHFRIFCFVYTYFFVSGHKKYLSPFRKTDISFLLFFYGEKVEGIYGVAVDSYFIVAVGTCAVSRASHEGHDRAFFYFLSFLYEDDRVMAVAGGDSVAVFYFYQVAVTADPA